MFAIDESASSFCAREMRGTLSIASTVAFFAASACSRSGFCAGQMKLTRICPSRIARTSSSVGARTLKMMSARDHTEAASGTTVAPQSAYAWSARLAPSPAPACTTTPQPTFTSFGTTSGTVATRFSPGKTSLGTPITWVMGVGFYRRPSVILSPKSNTEGGQMRRWIAAFAAVVAAFGLATAGAQDKKTRISIGTGGTGGVYYPLGGGLAALLSKYVPGVDATAEVTAGSIANLQLIDSGKSEIGFTMADAAWDAVNGLDKFSAKRVPLRTLAVFYPNRMHVVTIEGTGINAMKDLKGKRVSTGAPVSGTEVTA